MASLIINQKVIEIIEYLNKYGKVYIVGGALRNHLINKPIIDYDLEVYHLSFNALIDLLQDQYQIRVNQKYGSIKIMPNIEITLPRLETILRSDYEHHKVIINENLKILQASQRRDYTCNALYYDFRNNELIDLHNSKEAILKRELRYINEDLFITDSIRVLRGLNLAFTYNFIFDDQTLILVKEMSNYLIQEKYNRTSLYFNKIIVAPYFNAQIFISVLALFFKKDKANIDCLNTYLSKYEMLLKQNKLSIKGYKRLFYLIIIRFNATLLNYFSTSIKEINRVNYLFNCKTIDKHLLQDDYYVLKYYQEIVKE
ncbi:MAG: hypothetical protein ACRCTA_02730 [Bacilli bacterium]